MAEISIPERPQLLHGSGTLSRRVRGGLEPLTEEPFSEASLLVSLGFKGVGEVSLD